MSIESTFAATRRGAGPAMGMEEGLREALGQIDAILARTPPPL